MTMHELISEVQAKTCLPRELILRRAREAWPATIDFKDVQVRLLADQLRRSENPRNPTRVLSTAS
jgi:hypothetical protein